MHPPWFQAHIGKVPNSVCGCIVCVCVCVRVERERERERHAQALTGPFGESSSHREKALCFFVVSCAHAVIPLYPGDSVAKHTPRSLQLGVVKCVSHFLIITHSISMYLLHVHQPRYARFALFACRILAITRARVQSLLVC